MASQTSHKPAAQSVRKPTRSQRKQRSKRRREGGGEQSAPILERACFDRACVRIDQGSRHKSPAHLVPQHAAKGGAAAHSTPEARWRTAHQRQGAEAQQREHAPLRSAVTASAPCGMCTISAPAAIVEAAALAATAACVPTADATASMSGSIGREVRMSQRGLVGHKMEDTGLTNPIDDVTPRGGMARTRWRGSPWSVFLAASGLLASAVNTSPAPRAPPWQVNVTRSCRGSTPHGCVLARAFGMPRWRGQGRVTSLPVCAPQDTARRVRADMRAGARRRLHDAAHQRC